MPYAGKPSELAEFQCLLIGSWSNEYEKLNKSDRAKLFQKRDNKTLPLSYNVMPLPQVDEQTPRNISSGKYGGFILKNFAFTETIRFNGAVKSNDAQHSDPAALAVVAGAPNRGGGYTQFAHAVFYDQQVKFAEGPAEGEIVHVENGAWLHLGSREQHGGPYGKGSPAQNGLALRQPPYITIAKQIAVPHGNSVLALGSVDLYDLDKFNANPDGLGSNTVIPGSPIIPDAPVPYPAPAEITTNPDYQDPYATPLTQLPKDFENPSPEWTLNPNRPLQLAIAAIEPQAHIHWRVTTNPLFGGDGVVTNIPFEERKSKVTEYWADYWLLQSKETCDDKEYAFDYLAYTQTILMEMEIFVGPPGGSLHDPNNFRKYVFPHVTSNTVRRIGKTPTEGRMQTEEGFSGAPSARAKGK